MGSPTWQRNQGGPDGSLCIYIWPGNAYADYFEALGLPGPWSHDHEQLEQVLGWRGTSSLLWEQLTQSRRGSPGLTRPDKNPERRGSTSSGRSPSGTLSLTLAFSRTLVCFVASVLSHSPCRVRPL